MAIIALRAWYLQKYEPLKELEKRPFDLRLSQKSLLKSGLRADFLEDSQQVKRSPWFERYLDGEIVEFYIEGSGGYAIANIDLSSHEIYFTKQSVMADLEPTIFLCYQKEYALASEALREGLEKTVEKLNERSRLTLKLVESQRPTDSPLRLSEMMMRRIRKSLLFIADSTAIARFQGEEMPAQLIPSPKVCLELGYALQSKSREQILLAQMERPEMKGQFPFDLPNYQRIWFKDAAELDQMLPSAIEAQLGRYNLFS
jgi:hypothetical protein